MPPTVRRLVILGATGSIGRSTLEVVRQAGTRFQIRGLTANQSLELLCEQAVEFRPSKIVATDEAKGRSFAWNGLPRDVALLYGDQGVTELVTDPDVDVVVAAMVGSVGLSGAWRALEAGKIVALANKETLVVGGPLVMQLAHDRGGKILPIDSEHSAIFQAMRAGGRSEVQRVVLTASGGPFRKHTREQLEQVTVAEALAHPTWAMGKKITVDSATMMNKALEIVEARWLFQLRPEQIDVVVHPQSIVHSLVEFVDGSVVAQLSPPDMRLPIQYALSYPERWDGPAERLNWRQSFHLDFEPPDLDRFPALRLGHEVARAGGTAGAAMNAANEAAVAAFLAGKMRFTQIVPACRAVLETHTFDEQPSLERLLQVDTWARKEVTRWMGG